MIICGTIITIWVFMPAIIPSIAAGSVRGLGGAVGASLFGGPSLRYVPFVKASDRCLEIGA